MQDGGKGGSEPSLGLLFQGERNQCSGSSRGRTSSVQMLKGHLIKEGNSELFSGHCSDFQRISKSTQ